jgi:hypothetical protein
MRELGELLRFVGLLVAVIIAVGYLVGLASAEALARAFGW